ncbi:kinase-like protein [Gigaspora margarita]|uniref:Kinase-like protein n=1 Tax=Gigaspora margarita TaxID=4874 RepID=A0A8H4AHK0_GIGMA|nr:kinase-like protein [Gigaspora margarita]
MTNFTKLQWTDKLCIAKEIALGLLFLHVNNIIHRDLHSNNILIHQKQPKITDFGLSKQISETSMTSNSTAFGIPAYIEPQCFIQQGFKRDKRSNIYSFGVILWEISSGRPPLQNFESRIEALCKNSTLTSLNLENNKLGSEGGKALADALCNNSMLTSLNLYWNKLGFEGGKVLADALCKNSILTSLNLEK